MAEESPQNPNENAPVSRFRRLSRITQWVMIFGASGSFLCIGLELLMGQPSRGRNYPIFIFPLAGCMLAFFLGALAHVFLVVFGAMRLTLRSMLISALMLGFGVTCLASDESIFVYIGLAALSGLATFWVYHFFKASYEQDQRDGIV